MEPSLVQTLEDIRRELAGTFKGFPDGCCLITARRVEQQTGLPVAYGHFILDDGKAEEHAWNIDPKTGNYVDLTACAMEPGLPSIATFGRDTSEARERYILFYEENTTLP